MKCPRCIEKMEPADLAGYEAWACIYCYGHWVEYETLEKIIQKLNDQPEIINLPAFPETKSPAPGTRVCPSCKDTKLHLLDANDIELDICIKCKGIFFDDGELEQIAGEFPEGKKMPLLGWIAIVVAARLALGGLASA